MCMQKSEEIEAETQRFKALVQNFVSGFQKNTNPNSINEEKDNIKKAYRTLFDKGLADYPTVTEALREYRDTIVSMQPALLSMLEYANSKQIDNGGIKKLCGSIALSSINQFLEFGGIPSEELKQAVQLYQIELNGKATEIIKSHNDVKTGDLESDICKTMGLRFIAKKAVDSIKDLLHSSKSNVESKVTRNVTIDETNYSVECVFDEKGQSSKLSIKLVGTEDGITIDIGQTDLVFSKASIQEKQETER